MVEELRVPGIVPMSTVMFSFVASEHEQSRRYTRTSRAVSESSSRYHGFCMASQ
jgi:hypothetical protein